MTLLVAATLRSGPACCGRTWAAAAASGESGWLTIAAVIAPPARAASSARTRSGLAPDCDSETTNAPSKASVAP